MTKRAKKHGYKHSTKDERKKMLEFAVANPDMSWTEVLRTFGKSKSFQLVYGAFPGMSESNVIGAMRGGLLSVNKVVKTVEGHRKEVAAYHGKTNDRLAAIESQLSTYLDMNGLENPFNGVEL